jgi:hypothetical protein
MQKNAEQIKTSGSNFIKVLFHKETILFLLLCITVFFLFKKAIHIPFILDDFFFLNLGHAENISEFVQFFSPFKGIFYRPLTTESFYFLVNTFQQNVVLAHTIPFLFFFIGLYFLYKILYFLTRNTVFSFIFLFLYAIHFTHVFQLYMLNTFQEVALFMFLSLSTYSFLSKKYVISILAFIGALMSKETAIVYPGLLLLYSFYKYRLASYKNYRILILYFCLSIVFFFIYKYGASQVEEIAIYKIQLNPKLIVNNIQWYLLWSLGLPNFYPNYTKSILSIPSADFWNLLNYQDYKIYFYSLVSFYTLFLVSIIYYFLRFPKKIWFSCLLIILAGIGFLLFILPVLPIIHRWMVRLTIPLIFIAGVQAYFIYQFYISGKILQFFAIVLLLLYSIFNYVGIPIHESSSLIFLEADIVTNTQKYFTQHRDKILERKVLYFKDKKDSPFGGSKKLELTFHNQDFLNYYFPHKNLKAVYGFRTSQIPKGAYVISSDDLIFPK